MAALSRSVASDTQKRPIEQLRWKEPVGPIEQAAGNLRWGEVVPSAKADSN
jgi:hypothetical protein